MGIYIIDAPMGSGKTTGAIKMMNSNREKKFLYITPYLTEVDRIESGCKEMNFMQPDADPCKRVDLLSLLREGINIATTHALFDQVNDLHLQAVLKYRYTLVIDERYYVLNEIGVKKDDVRSIIDLRLIEQLDNHRVVWANKRYTGVFNQIKSEFKNRDVYLYRNMLFSMVPIKVFDAFEDVYIITYMFEGQLMSRYFKLYNRVYSYLYVDKNHDFVDYDTGINNVSGFKDLITVVDKYEMNRVGKEYRSLSHGWFLRKENSKQIDEIQKNTYNFFRNIARVKSNKVLWTTYKDVKNKLKGAGYTKGFVVHNVRATNMYSDRTAVAYLLNKYYNPVIKGFFKEMGLDIDENVFALSEMIQFIWRSAIRNGEPIICYIPSKRMRSLFIDWLNGDFNLNNKQY